MKIMNNMEKPHFFDKNQTLTTKFRYLRKGELFLYMCGESYIQDANVLSTPAT